MIMHQIFGENKLRIALVFFRISASEYFKQG